MEVIPYIQCLKRLCSDICQEDFLFPRSFAILLGLTCNAQTCCLCAVIDTCILRLTQPIYKSLSQVINFHTTGITITWMLPQNARIQIQESCIFKALNTLVFQVHDHKQRSLYTILILKRLILCPSFKVNRLCIMPSFS
jgi:hypothetical protein